MCSHYWSFSKYQAGSAAIPPEITDVKMPPTVKPEILQSENVTLGADFSFQELHLWYLHIPLSKQSLNETFTLTNIIFTPALSIPYNPNKETVGNSPAIGVAASSAQHFQSSLHFQGSCFPKILPFKHTRCREKLGCKGAFKLLRFDHCSKTFYEFRTPLQGKCKSEQLLANTWAHRSKAPNTKFRTQSSPFCSCRANLSCQFMGFS